MKSSTERALDRALRKLNKSSNRRPPGRVGTAPFALGIGLFLGYFLLAWLVPRLWNTVLPGGIAQASRFRGLPGLVFQGALYANHYAYLIPLAALAATAVALAICRLGFPFRLAVWILGVMAVLLDAAILVIALQAGIAANAAASGLPL